MDRYPLKYGDVKQETSIIILEKMFNVFAFITEYKKFYEDKSKRSKLRKDATTRIRLVDLCLSRRI